MKTTRSVVILLGLVIGLGTGIPAAWQKQEARRETDGLKASNAETVTKIAELHGKLREARESLPEIERQIEEAAAVATRQAKERAEAQTKTVAAAGPFRAEIALVNEPRKGAAYANNLRTSFPLVYAGLFHSLGLAPAKVEELTELLVWLEMSRLDLIATEAAQGLDQSNSKKAWNDWFELRRTKLAAVLGEHNERFREWEKTAVARRIVARLASAEAHLESPLTPARIEQVSTLLAAHSRRAPGTNLVVPGTIDWGAASAALVDVLPPSQIETLGYFVQSEAADAKLNDERRRLTAQFNGRSPSR